MIPDMNDIIGENITEVLREKGKTVEELAEALNLSVTEVRQVLWGIQVINGPMMSAIAVYLGIERARLVRILSNIMDRDIMGLFGSRVSSENGKHAIRLADEISDMILFHSRVRKNGEQMMHPSV